MEFILMQSYSEREKQSKIIDDLTNKYIMIENEKNELENLVNFCYHSILNDLRIGSMFTKIDP